MKCDCIETGFLIRYLDKLYDLLSEAYHTTPIYVSSKNLVARAREMVHNLRVSLGSICLE